MFLFTCRYHTDLLRLTVQFVKELLMVQEIAPFYTNYEINGPTWYISAMLVSTVIITSIKNMSPKSGDTWVTALSILCYLVMAGICGDLHTHGVLVMIPKGVIRATASMGFGCALSNIRFRLSGVYCAIFWALSIALSLIVCSIARDSMIDFLIIPFALGTVLFGAKAFFEDGTPINQYSRVLGKLSLYIYLWHTLARNILSNVFGIYSLQLYFGATGILAIFAFLINEMLVKRIVAKSSSG